MSEQMEAELSTLETPVLHGAAHLQAEIDGVRARLLATLDELFPPLSNLAQAHCRDVQPHLRAAIVLTTWDALVGTLDVTKTDTQDREKVLLLGSALEMLSVALSIHRLLLLPSSDNSLDKALVGSTILTGDYCFSRAAGMAAQTESAFVVDIFSRALKQVSEESLRGLFGDPGDMHGEDAILASAGVRAVCHLLQVDADATAIQLNLALRFALRQPAEFEGALVDPDLGAHAQNAWSALAAWAAHPA